MWFGQEAVRESQVLQGYLDKRQQWPDEWLMVIKLVLETGKGDTTLGSVRGIYAR